MVVVRFACGHSARVDADTTPRCAVCDETQVAHVRARAPRFVGVATGPLCDTKPLEAIPVSVARTPLILKEQR